ncbi:ribonuclease III [Tautonia sociabilis]|uniref:Ribonuclease 3 n=1 Tax=Tautonia sociabilis TaxID=2080755 RepID=A0A432MP52_9BACT|nr:ribonuclease III [Tautonia sociabilis]RUL89039.1 ribonuclease III [Tautonia sociabilis]
MPQSDPPEDDLLELCQRAIGYRFADPALLRSALTHASGADHRLASNERLEFLGDAVLGLIVCDLLYRGLPESLEGELTRIKSVVVSRQSCAEYSRKLGFEAFLTLGKGMSGFGPTPSSVLADVFESVLGALYLDGGMETARRFLEPIVNPEIAAAVENQAGTNHKSTFQQVAQREFGATPTYRLLDEQGPDHSKCFKIAAQVGPHKFPPAWGRNKKEAEQRAALNALCQIAGDPIPFASG